MNVLGIVHEHNATVCLMQDGVVTFCQGEERLDRIKSSTGFPVCTLRHVYDRIVEPGEIDLAVIFETTVSGYLAMKARGFVPVPGAQSAPTASAQRSFRQWLRETRAGAQLRAVRQRRTEQDPVVRRESQAWFAAALALDASRVRYLDHHTSHAWSVMPAIRRGGRTLVFTLDGYGDGLSATVSLCEGGKLRRLGASEERHSLGTYYHDTTRILGMKALEDEWKVMGLAPYARPAHYASLLARLRNLLGIDARGGWRSLPEPDRLFATLEEVFRLQRFDHVAGAMQALTEELIVAWVRHWVRATGCANVAVAGGVFMNVKAAQRVAALEEIERLEVMPSAGDESCAIGAAAWGTSQLDPTLDLQPLRGLYLGQEFSDDEVEGALQATGAGSRYTISRPANIEHQAARLLAANRIVARFSGRMEFGARALGNRSILAHPGHPANVARLNAAVKGREFWMPFAPSILEEDMALYVRDAGRIYAPYMCVSFDSTAQAQKELPATLHPADLTLRPQAVRKSWNPKYYELIESFKALTGVGAVLNTSFNLHGEPIVCSPLDAIRVADRSAIDCLELGGFLLERRTRDPSPHEDLDTARSFARA
ncbi:MAG: carbamoyltransferase C-terminal domain-containing protein [Betaproteobacteria bacterium]